MTDKLYVLNEGQGLPTDFTTDPPAEAHNTNSSVNPRLLTIMGTTSPTATNRSNIEIHSDDTTTLAGGTKLFPTGASDFNAPNAFNTPSYRVTIDVNNTSGLTFDTTKDYFILIHSDNLLKHHFAKITEQTQYDGEFWSYDFTPKMDSPIDKGVNVTIYTGPPKTDNVVALAYGLLNDTNSSEERHDRYVDATRPTFYFYENDRLDHNRKYVAIKTFTPASNTMTSVFKTASTSSDYILDKSFFTQNAVIVDSNKTADETLGTYSSWSANIVKFDGRAGSTPISTYINFKTSPVRNQQMSFPVDVNIQNTITNRGNFFEATYIDPERFLDRKIKDNESIEIKNFIGSDFISEAPSFILPGVFNNHATTNNKITVTGLVNGQDLRRLMYSSSSDTSYTGNDYDLLYLNNFFYVISDITAPVDGSQTITISHKRQNTSPIFVSTSTVETLSDASGRRRRWSTITESMGVTHKIDTILQETSNPDDTIKRNNLSIEEIEADINGLEYLLTGENYGVKLTIQKGDELNSYTKLKTIPSSIFNTSGNLVDCMKTDLIFNKIIMSANIEFKETNVDRGAFTVKISGRDKLSQLLGSPINKNYLYTEEYLYSSIPVFSTEDTTLLTKIGLDSISNDTLSVTVKSGEQLNTYVSPGDVLYIKTEVSGTSAACLFLGIVNYVDQSSNEIILLRNSIVQDLTNIGTRKAFTLETTTVNSTSKTAIYKNTPLLYAGKSLENYNNITGPTTLLGSLDKGYVFEGGENFSKANTDSDHSVQGTLEELTDTTSNNGKAIIDLIDTIILNDQHVDNPIGIKLTETIHTTSSMVEFDILNSIPSNQQITYQIGYVSPVVAGRIYGNNRNEVWIDSASTTSNRHQDNFYLVNAQGIPNGGFMHLLDNRLSRGDDKNANPLLQTNAPQTFNYVYEDDWQDSGTTKGQYMSRYGPAIWRYTNKHSGDFYQALPTKGVLHNESNSVFNDYYENGGIFNFSLSAYRTSGNLKYYNDLVHYVPDHRDEKSAERVGTRPAVGSRFFDIDRYPHDFKSNENNAGRFMDKDDMNSNYSEFEIWDPRAGTLHLFSTGHLYPESKLNWDNLDSYVTKDITKYSIVLKNDSKTSNILSHYSDTYPTDWLGVGDIGNRLDGNYENRAIVSSSGDRNRFNLVRLTEVVFDFLMNEVDYENYEVDKLITDRNEIMRSTGSLRPQNIYRAVDTGAQLQVAITTSNNQLTVDDITWIDTTKNQVLYSDPDGASNSNGVSIRIGELDRTFGSGAGYTGSGSPYTIQLTTNSAIAYAINEKIFAITQETTADFAEPRVYRTSEKDVAFEDTYTAPNRCDKINKTIAITLPSTSTPYTLPTLFTNYSSAVTGFMKRPIIRNRNQSNAIETSGDFAHRVIYDSQSGVNAFDYKFLDPVIMNYEPLPTEAQSSFKDLYAPQFKGAILNTSNSNSVSNIPLRLTLDGGSTTEYTSMDIINTPKGFLEDDEESGATADRKIRLTEILFRPRLPTVSTPETGGVLESDEAVFKWDVVQNAFSGTPSSQNNWLHYCNNLTGYYLYNVTQNSLHYIKSHTISTVESNQFRHYIRVDNYSSSWATDDVRLMKISQDCFYNFSPKSIELNKFSSRYTKIPGRDSTHESFVASAEDTLDGKPIFKEGGIASMYCLVNIDGSVGNDEYLVTRDPNLPNVLTNSFSLGEHNVFVTDGIEKLQTSMKIGYDNNKPTITFNKITSLRGSPSVGSIFTVTVDKGASFTPTKAQICTPINIVYETEDIVDDILSNIGIDYNKSTIGNSYYMSANFTGENAYVAANSVLSYKNKKLLVKGDDITVVANEENRFYRDIEINEDNTDFQIIKIKRDKSLFDKFNVITVIGDGVRAVSKNYRDIKKQGREINKEVYDFSITNKKQAQQRANQLVKIHSGINEAIEIEIGDDAPYLEPGQIISVHYPSESIPRAPYIIIEIERRFGRPTKVKLGEYNRDLANTMSLLLSETRNLQGRTKQKVYSNVSSPNIDLQNIRIKFVKAEVTNQNTAATSTIGFGYTIGFNSEVGP